MQNLVTPLIRACKNRTGDVAWLLISAGADVFARDEHGQTALQVAKRHNRADLVQKLQRMMFPTSVVSLSDDDADGDEDTSTVDQSRSVNMSIDLVDAGDAVDQDAVTSDAADDSHPNQHRYVCVCVCVRA